MWMEALEGWMGTWLWHRSRICCLPTLMLRLFLPFLSMETNNLWLLSLRGDSTARWLVYLLLSLVDWSCVALSLFQEMHGHSCLKENPHDCIVFSAEWHLATSFLLLADHNAASLLCATHHAVTNIIQQKKNPSKVTMFSSLVELVEAPFIRYCFLFASLPQVGIEEEQRGQNRSGKLIHTL